MKKRARNPMRSEPEQPAIEALPRAFDYVLAHRWAITAEALNVIESIALRTNDISALAARRGDTLRGTEGVEVMDQTAVIKIIGPISRYANLFSQVSGATSVEILATDFRAALDDPSIRDILLYVDSPGGNSVGINELANMVFQARGIKPIAAYIGGEGNSAAYWIASAVDPGRLFIDATGLAGSIGVRAKVLDTSGRDARSGVRTIDVVSTLSPDKLVDATTDEGRAKIQTVVDQLAEVFVGTVARNRGVPFETVARDFGRGDVMVGATAVRAGLVDSVSSMEQVLADLKAARERAWRFFPMSTKPQAQTTTTVSSTDELRAALTAGRRPDEITVQTVDVDAVRAEARAAVLAEVADSHLLRTEHDAALAQATAAATAAERERVLAIQALVPVGYEKIGAECVADGRPLPEAALAIARAVKERGGVTVAGLRAEASAAVGHTAPADVANSGSRWGKITKKFKASANR